MAQKIKNFLVQWLKDAIKVSISVTVQIIVFTILYVILRIIGVSQEVTIIVIVCMVALLQIPIFCIKKLRDFCYPPLTKTREEQIILEQKNNK